MVGLPCGQFQGCSTPSNRRTILVRALRSKAVPIITADRQARLANIDTTYRRCMENGNQGKTRTGEENVMSKEKKKKK